MMLGLPKGPVCQSCSMPLEKPEDFGTSGDGLPVTDFCRHCFTNGTFVDPLISESAMIEQCVGFIVSQGDIAPVEARALMTRVIPTLKRWRPQHEPRPA
jgi:hypothetical protein